MAEIKVGDYLFQRLAQLSIKTVWGVPGGSGFMLQRGAIGELTILQIMNSLC